MGIGQGAFDHHCGCMGVIVAGCCLPRSPPGTLAAPPSHGMAPAAHAWIERAGADAASDACGCLGSSFVGSFAARGHLGFALQAPAMHGDWRALSRLQHAWRHAAGMPQCKLAVVRFTLVRDTHVLLCCGLLCCAVCCMCAQVGAVVVGFDRYVNYYKIQYATLCIRENPGCMFIATNRDAVTHLTDAQEWAGERRGGVWEGACVYVCGGAPSRPQAPMRESGRRVACYAAAAQRLYVAGMLQLDEQHRYDMTKTLAGCGCGCGPAGNGSMVGAIVGSTKREPTTVGKPSDFMLKNISASLGLRPEQICMVGDRLDTDIMFGKNGGLTTGLVLSGERRGKRGGAGGGEGSGRGMCSLHGEAPGSRPPGPHGTHKPECLDLHVHPAPTAPGYRK